MIQAVEETDVGALAKWLDLVVAVGDLNTAIETLESMIEELNTSVRYA